MPASRRVVVTGFGVVAPGGVGTEAFWNLISTGRTATGMLTAFDSSPFRSRVCAEIVNFDAAALGVAPQDVDHLDRAAQLAIVAADEAATMAGGVRDVDPYRIGVSIGTAIGATQSLEREFCAVTDNGRHPSDPRLAVPHLSGYLAPTNFATNIATRFGAQGPVHVVSTGCTSGIDAVGYGAELISDGLADLVLAGATDAPISPSTISCFDAIKATTPRTDSPERASRPFDRTRDGFVLGEGAAVFVLEDAETARARSAHSYGEIRGYATRSNAYHMTGLRRDGRELAEAIRASLKDAELHSGDIEYISAHGSGTSQNDLHETQAYKEVFGRRAHQIPISSIKSMIGHSLGAIGAIEIAACILAIVHDFAPPTANLTEPDPQCDLDYVPIVGRDLPISNVLTVGSGFGGFQSAMVISGMSA